MCASMGDYGDTLAIQQNHEQADCVLLFSGGRDSTLAAVRLGNQYRRIVLVTITTGHMVGIDRVRNRLSELGRFMSGNDTIWLQVSVAPAFARQFGLGHQSCLACHHLHVAAAVKIAEEYSARRIALGYTAYQSNWIEQTPYAISQLTQALQTANMQLLLPVLDINSKDQAKTELRKLGLTDAALEQKCLKQQIDPEDGLSEASKAEIRRWRDSLETAIKKTTAIPLEVMKVKRVSELSESVR
jgi:tRNA U34 2-thiouridine synthase MnmA/TrmU